MTIFFPGINIFYAQGRTLRNRECVIIGSMIAALTGIVSEKLGEMVILDVKGVGYGVLVTASDGANLTEGEKTKLYIHEYLREDLHDLYGFRGQETKQFFEQLLSVNGVGPRMALHIMGVGTMDEVRRAIANGDTKFIQAAHGVGRRVAERVVVDLKDKVGLAVGAGTDRILTSSSLASKDEAVQALVALGYSQQDALAALAEVDSKLPAEERIKQALKGQA